MSLFSLLGLLRFYLGTEVVEYLAVIGEELGSLIGVGGVAFVLGHECADKGRELLPILTQSSLKLGLVKM